MLPFKKNDFGVFQPSARARVLCCKNEVVLHKTYLAICSDANKSASKGSTLSSRNVCFKAMKYRLIAWV
ncbi:hypothetical protein EII41_02645 [Tannerella forsythia]|uniref:Uncharacterized protein n=1 Tax=Tannerella forsythia TaxID=28112 RepID=A0A3P1Z560_TANFO|nr:hypothetical protein EII41_02645 [Tannerella forsythia]